MSAAPTKFIGDETDGSYGQLRNRLTDVGSGSAPAIPWIELTALEAARELGSAARRLPAADVCDGSGEIVVELEVAGFAPEALSVEVHATRSVPIVVSPG